MLSNWDNTSAGSWCSAAMFTLSEWPVSLESYCRIPSYSTCLPLSESTINSLWVFLQGYLASCWTVYKIIHFNCLNHDGQIAITREILVVYPFSLSAPYIYIPVYIRDSDFDTNVLAPNGAKPSAWQYWLDWYTCFLCSNDTGRTLSSLKTPYTHYGRSSFGMSAVLSTKLAVARLE